jgi:hypothetical protein
MARGMGAVLFPIMLFTSVGVAVISGAVIGIFVALWRKKGDDAEEEDDDAPWEPETFTSLFKCGFGYLLAFDVVGLMIPKFYKSWFGEDPYAVEEVEDDPEVSLTMIPFGPHLALGALITMLFWPTLDAAIQAYWKSFSRG